jgi:hypothetical protein
MRFEGIQISFKRLHEGLPPLTDRSDLDAISVLATLAALYAVLKLGLLPALLAGLLIAQLVHSTVPVLYRFGIANRKLGRVIALTLVTVIVTTVIALLVVDISTRLTAGPSPSHRNTNPRFPAVQPHDVPATRDDDVPHGSSRSS